MVVVNNEGNESFFDKQYDCLLNNVRPFDVRSAPQRECTPQRNCCNQLCACARLRHSCCSGVSGTRSRQSQRGNWSLSTSVSDTTELGGRLVVPGNALL